MKLFRRYLAYRLNKTILRSIVFTIFSVIITWIVVHENVYGRKVSNKETGLYILAIVLGVICTLIPILELSEFKNRRNLDTLYFFPIKREKMALVHFLSGFIQIVVIYTVTFISALIYLISQTRYFALEYMIAYYFLSLILGFMIYSIVAFFFVQGNTRADGILFCVLWMPMLILVGSTVLDVLSQLVTVNYLDVIDSWGTIYSPINNLTEIFQYLIEVNKPHNHRTEMVSTYVSQMYMFFVWGALGIAAAVGYFVTFVKKGAEKVGEISDSWFGYRVLIPIYAYCIFLDIGVQILLIDIIVFALMVIGYVTYRRGFRLKLSDLIVIGCSTWAIFLSEII